MQLSTTDPPFYVMFFIIAGAELDLATLPSMGWLGLIYVTGRAAGKLAGARLATWRLGLDTVVQRLLGFSLLAQAGLAVGLTLAVGRHSPQFAPIVTTVVLVSVAVFEVIGPTSTRYALVRAGEVGARNTRPHTLAPEPTVPQPDAILTIYRQPHLPTANECEHQRQVQP